MSKPGTEGPKVVIRPRRFYWYLVTAFEVVVVLAAEWPRHGQLFYGTRSVWKLLGLMGMILGVWCVYLLPIRIVIADGLITSYRLFSFSRTATRKVHYLKNEGRGTRGGSIILYDQQAGRLANIETLEYDFSTLRREFRKALVHAPIGEQLTWCAPYRQSVQIR